MFLCDPALRKPWSRCVALSGKSGKKGVEGGFAMKKTSDDYLKIVEWSEEDRCYVGMAPGLIIGGVHGRNQKKVFGELCEAVEEAIQILQKEGRPLPTATANKKYSGKIALRIPPPLHKTLAMKAFQEGESLNKLIQYELEEAI